MQTLQRLWTACWRRAGITLCHDCAADSLTQACPTVQPSLMWEGLSTRLTSSQAWLTIAGMSWNLGPLQTENTDSYLPIEEGRTMETQSLGYLLVNAAEDAIGSLLQVLNTKMRTTRTLTRLLAPQSVGGKSRGSCAAFEYTMATRLLDKP